MGARTHFAETRLAPEPGSSVTGGPPTALESEALEAVPASASTPPVAPQTAWEYLGMGAGRALACKPLVAAPTARESKAPEAVPASACTPPAAPQTAWEYLGMGAGRAPACAALAAAPTALESRALEAVPATACTPPAAPQTAWEYLGMGAGRVLACKALEAALTAWESTGWAKEQAPDFEAKVAQAAATESGVWAATPAAPPGWLASAVLPTALESKAPEPVPASASMPPAAPQTAWESLGLGGGRVPELEARVAHPVASACLAPAVRVVWAEPSLARERRSTWHPLAHQALPASKTTRVMYGPTATGSCICASPQVILAPGAGSAPCCRRSVPRPTPAG